MSDQITRQLEHIALQDSHVASYTSLQAHALDPFSSLPPEILSHIFYHSVDHSYQVEKGEYARFCLVNKRFLSIAREHLYSRLTLTVPMIPSEALLEEQSSRLSEEILREAGLISTLFRSPQCARLVKVLDVAFQDIPPSEDSGRTLCDLLVRLTKLQEMWLLDMGKGFWQSPSTRTVLDTSSDIVYRLIRALLLAQKNSLKVLVIPQIELRPIDTYLLFTSITSLETYKGTILSAPAEANGLLSKSVVCRLRRLYITHFHAPRDLHFVLSASLASLAYLHLTFHLENNSSLDLSNLRNHETLVLTAQFNGPGAFVANSREEAKSTLTHHRTVKNSFLDKVFSTASSARKIESLKVFSLFTNLGNYIAPHFQRHFLELPPSIVELSIGPTPASTFPWSILFRNLHLYPSLRKLYLTVPTPSSNSSSAPVDPSEAYFGISEKALEEKKGLKVRWFEDEYAWLPWKENRFYGLASIQEMMGKPNEFALGRNSSRTVLCRERGNEICFERRKEGTRSGFFLYSIEDRTECDQFSRHTHERKIA